MEGNVVEIDVDGEKKLAEIVVFADFSPDSISTNKYHCVSSTGLNDNLVQSGETILYCGSISNNGNSQVYLKFYDMATYPIVGTSPVVKSIMCPNNSTLSLVKFIISGGDKFSNGLAFSITGGASDDDVTPINENQVIVDLYYK